MKRTLMCRVTLTIAMIVSLFIYLGHAEAASQIYCTSDDGLSLTVIETSTAVGSVIGPFGNTAMGLAIDNSDGTFYTIVDSGIGPSGPRPTEQLAVIDPLTGQTTRIGLPMWNWIEVNAAVPAVEVGNDGYVYAGGVDGTFYRINKATGEPTLISSQSLNLVMDYAFDSSGTLWAIAGTRNDLYTVDPITGAAVFVKRISGVTSVGSGIMGIMFDKNDVMYATNMADNPDAHLYIIDINAGAAADQGVLNLMYPHGGDIYLPRQGCIQQPSGLISWWLGDGNADDIMGANNGAPMNGTAYAAGKAGQGFSLDGVDDYIDAGTNDIFNFNNGAGDFTIDAWIKLTDFSPWAGTIVSKGAQNPFSGWAFYVYSDGRLGFGGIGIWELISSSGAITPGDWSHVAVIKSGGTYKLYKDGVEIASTVYGDLQTSVAPLTIGTDFVGLNQAGTFVDLRFKGVIDEVDIFNRALTASEIASIYNAGSAGKCKPGCTDNDNDTYSIEGGVCGAVDCNDGNPAINPGATDNNCNGVDENCSGSVDEGYIITPSTCGVGICAASGQYICREGSIVNTCNPGQPQNEGPVGDPTCADGNDNDCDGLTDTPDPNCQSLNSDLVVSALTAPSTAGAGQTISVTDTTKNNGPGSAGASTTRIYWSVNNTYDPGDIELAGRSVTSLTAGAVSTGNTSITIPADASDGTYYLIARADADRVVSEKSETNNTRSTSIKIGSDLVVSALTAPSTAGAGQTISVTDTTRNNGPGSAGASTTRFYWSVNNTYDSGDLELAGRAAPSLTAGAVSIQSTSITIPADASDGTYYIIARADADRVITETNETNNTRSTSIKIGSDLVVSALTAPSTAGAGQTISVTDTTRNNGPGSAGASTTRIYWSVNNTYDPGDIELAGRSVPSLTAGAVSTGNTSITIPADASAGTYYIIARADADRIITETNENNNTRSRSIKIGPDLTIPYVSAPTGASLGSTVVVTDVTRNVGGGAAGASTTKIYLSADAVYDAGDTELGSRSIPSLAAGAFSRGNTSVTIPVGIPVGAYYIIAVSDADGAVAEVNEANNFKPFAITLTP
ncbi:MAG: hypothetical protein HZA14_02380 [Nitrospirae bacterium]|nr:hypothetical protein [Nitrospirota bacterium]